MRTHTAEKTHKCEVCGQEFLQSGHLTNHMKRHTGEKPYKCKGCDKGFSRSSTLDVHMRTHTAEKPHKCEVCGQEFLHSGHLTNHMMTHTGETLKCEVCGNTYSSSHYLTVHKRTHTGEKPYTCQVCGKGYISSNDLRRHWMTHTGEKPCKCKVCGKGFYTPSEFNVHMRTHTGEKQYNCMVCGQEFSKTHLLVIHMKGHKDDIPYIFNNCENSPDCPDDPTLNKMNNTGDKHAGFGQDDTADNPHELTKIKLPVQYCSSSSDFENIIYETKPTCNDNSAGHQHQLIKIEPTDQIWKYPQTVIKTDAKSIIESQVVKVGPMTIDQLKMSSETMYRSKSPNILQILQKDP